MYVCMYCMLENEKSEAPTAFLWVVRSVLRSLDKGLLLPPACLTTLWSITVISGLATSMQERTRQCDAFPVSSF